MNKTQEVTINLPEEIAQFYLTASEAEKRQIELQISLLMKLKVNTKEAEKVDSLRQLMDDISNKAMARGLTLEILEEILNENE